MSRFDMYPPRVNRELDKRDSPPYGTQTHRNFYEVYEGNGRKKR